MSLWVSLGFRPNSEANKVAYFDEFVARPQFAAVFGGLHQRTVRRCFERQHRRSAVHFRTRRFSCGSEWRDEDSRSGSAFSS